MKFLEEETLNSAPVKPVLWKRYVDETLCIVKKGSDKHLNHLNSVRPSIKFTMESDEDIKLPFLDCILKRVTICLHPLCTENLHMQIDTFTLGLIILIM